MNKQEFMLRLEALLDGIPEEEKKEALAFYISYFEDAGEENEEKILQELESPEQVAKTIRANLGLGETVKQETSAAAAEESRGGSGTGDMGQNFQSGYQKDFNRNAVPPRQDSGRTVLVVLLIILTCPIWIGVLGGIFGGICGIFFGVLGAALGCLIGGAAAFGIGISLCAGGMAAVGLITMGAALLVFALGLAALALFVVICGRFIPWLVRGIVSLVQRLLYGRKEVPGV